MTNNDLATATKPLAFEEKFALVHKHVIADERITLKAKALFQHIVSKEKGHNFSIERIAQHCIEGPDSVRSGVQELEKAGYVFRARTRNKKGQLKNGIWLVNKDLLATEE